MGNYLITLATCLLITMLLLPAEAKGSDLDELKQLISSINDPKITVFDLAFFMATHSYDARPVKDYVELNLGGKVYKLIPNGDNPGLCELIPSTS